MSQRKAVRFWIYHKPVNQSGGMVRVALTPNKDLTWGGGGPTDEGYHFDKHVMRISDCGECVEYHWYAEGRDCDGPYTFGVKSVFRISDELELDEESGLMIPKWMSEEEYEQDCFAESAGY